MELLIPGLILVALMVWASTKIKKSAAAAYAEETVATDRFTIIKPEDFIIPANEGSPFLFEARTKEHETIGRESVPAASVTVRESSDDFDKVCSEIKGRADSVLDEDVHREGTRVCVITAEESENGTAYIATYKIVDAGKSVLVLRSLTLPEQSEELMRKIEGMVRSFSTN